MQDSWVSLRLVGDSVPDSPRRLSAPSRTEVTQLCDYSEISCVTVKRYAPTFVHQKYRWSGSQGPWPWLLPILASGLAVMGRNASVGGFPPTAIAQDMTSNASYRIPGRWHMWCDITAYVIFRWYKSGCAPFPGVLLPLGDTENISTPPASWASL